MMTKDAIRRLIVAAAIVLLGAAPANLAATAGNDIYEVTVEEAPAGPGLGVYTFRTGFMHPVTVSLGAQDLLVGMGIPGTSYTTIRSYTSGTDYVQRNNLTLSAGAPPTLELEGFVAAGEEAIPVGDPQNPSGLMTVYRPGGNAPAPDDLVITQTVEAAGTTFDDSAVMLRTEITNNGGAPVAVGVRYLLDVTIGQGDDGPTFMTQGPDGSRLSAEADFLDPNFESFELTDDNDSGPCFGFANYQVPFYSVLGSVKGPASLSPTAPTRVAYVSWPDASGLPSKFGGVIPPLDAFDYQASGYDVSTCLVSYDDAGVAYWWGDTATNALSIAPGQTVSVAAYLFAYPPGTPPALPQPGVEGPAGDPSCSDAIDNDADGLVDAGDPDCAPPAPTVEGPSGDPSCSDGIDNDADGLVDADDPDCDPPSPAVEGPPGDPSCSDSVDNDADGLVDMDDPDCVPPPPAVEGPPGDPSCSDSVDNDADGLMDMDDPGCVAAGGALPMDCGAAVASRQRLWHANHKRREVTIGGVTDSNGAPVPVVVTSILQDEPVEWNGGGRTCPDAWGLGTDTVSLRSERNGVSDGRVYHINFIADDGMGGMCSGEVTVCVPHDRSSYHDCIDQGPLFDSTGPCADMPKKKRRWR